MVIARRLSHWLGQWEFYAASADVLFRRRVIDSACRQACHLNRVLPAGRAELARWVDEVSEPRPLRDELMVRLRAAAVLGTTSLAEDLRSRLQRHRDMLARYREIEARDFTPPPATRDARLRHLVLKAGIRHESSWIDLCVDALEILSAD